LESNPVSGFLNQLGASRKWKRKRKSPIAKLPMLPTHKNFERVAMLVIDKQTAQLAGVVFCLGANLDASRLARPRGGVCTREGVQFGCRAASTASVQSIVHPPRLPICCTWRDKPSDALEFIHFVPLINASMNLGPGAQCAVTMPPGPCIAPLVLFVEVIRVEAGRHQLTSSGCLCSTTTGTPEALKHQGRLWLQTSLVFSNTSIFTSYGP